MDASKVETNGHDIDSRAYSNEKVRACKHWTPIRRRSLLGDGFDIVQGLTSLIDNTSLQACIRTFAK